MADSKAILKAHESYRKLQQEGKIPTIREKFRRHPTPLKAIRLMCIDCQGGSRKGPKTCDSKDCPLWLFRMGRKDRSLLKNHSTESR